MKERDTSASSWLDRFHDGDRAVLEQCYREHFDTVARAVSRYLQGADQETVVHDVFYALLSQREMREGFRGGAIAAWLTTVGRNRAVDYLRRHRRVRSLEANGEGGGLEPAAPGPGPDASAEASLLLDKIRAQLPDKWRPVFEARFVLQLSQREAAAQIGITRTTLAYRELRVRALLGRIVSDADFAAEDRAASDITEEESS
ncbi:MAG: sigma-70 family RNA polymerase sigma factor [Myxococcales bacterium]|nr:sigma-70 family RNA polymerase sigma factor [Myxococcales bacterium]